MIVSVLHNQIEVHIHTRHTPVVCPSEKFKQNEVTHTFISGENRVDQQTGNAATVDTHSGPDGSQCGVRAHSLLRSLVADDELVTDGDKLLVSRLAHWLTSKQLPNSQIKCPRHRTEQWQRGWLCRYYWMSLNYTTIISDLLVLPNKKT